MPLIVFYCTIHLFFYYTLETFDELGIIKAAFSKLIRLNPSLTPLLQLGDKLCRGVQILVRQFEQFKKKAHIVVLRDPLDQLLVLIVALDLLNSVLLGLTLALNPARLIFYDILQQEPKDKEHVECQESY